MPARDVRKRAGSPLQAEQAHRMKRMEQQKESIDLSDSDSEAEEVQETPVRNVFNFWSDVKIWNSNF